MNSDNRSFDPLFVRNAIESALRIGLLFVLLWLAYDIIKPFIKPIIRGAIIAIAAIPLVKWIEPKVGGRRGLAAVPGRWGRGFGGRGDLDHEVACKR